MGLPRILDTMTPALAIFFVFGFGAGPILHHLAVRAEVWAPFGPRVPACESCGSALPWLGLRSFDCPTCGVRRRLGRELAVSLVTGLLFMAALWIGGNPLIVASHVLLAAVTVILFVSDVDQKIIPNRILYPGGSLAILVLGAGAVLDGDVRRFGLALGTGVGYFGLFYLVAVIARGGFGFGDVKLAALLGTFTGYPGWETFALSLFLTGFVGAVPALVLLVLKRTGAKQELPYGPAMLIGAWIALIFGAVMLARI